MVSEPRLRQAVDRLKEVAAAAPRAGQVQARRSEGEPGSSETALDQRLLAVLGRLDQQDASLRRLARALEAAPRTGSLDPEDVQRIARAVAADRRAAATRRRPALALLVLVLGALLVGTAVGAWQHQNLGAWLVSATSAL
jgi:hypothetical protein